MPISHIKTRRAFAKASIGAYPASREVMLDRIPDAVCAALTSSQLGLLLDAMWDACQEAKSIAARDAIREGAIWDAAKGRLVELAS